MPQDAGLDIDYDDSQAMDRELARIQGAVSGVTGLPDPREETRREQEPAVVSGTVVDDKRTVEFLGRKFRVADKIGAMPLLKFSMYADLSVNDPKALAAMYAMLRDCIYPGTPACGECERCEKDDETSCTAYDPGDWAAFENHAMDTRAGAEDLMDVITRTMELLAGRPTQPSSGSSAGRRSISGGSTARSSARRGKGSRR